MDLNSLDTFAVARVPRFEVFRMMDSTRANRMKKRVRYKGAPLFMRYYLLVDSLFESLARLEYRNVRFGNDDGRVGRNVAGGFCCTMPDAESTKASKIYGFALYDGALDRFHDALDDCGNSLSVNAG